MQNNTKTPRSSLDVTSSHRSLTGRDARSPEVPRPRVNTTKLLHYEIDEDLAKAFVAA